MNIYAYQFTKNCSFTQFLLQILEMKFIQRFHKIIIINQSRVEVVMQEQYQIHISTWQKQHNELYDYSSFNDVEKNVLNGPCKIFKNITTSATKIVGNESANLGAIPSLEYCFLGSIQFIENDNNPEQGKKLTLVRPKTPKSKKQAAINQSNQLYVSLHSLTFNKKTHEIEQGDVIKFGKILFSVVEINTSSSSQIKKIDFPVKKQSYQQQQQNNEEKENCKFCLHDEQTQNNFLISPCDCKGSCNRVHIDCLRQWIKSKVKRQVQGIVATYNFTKFNCQICKAPFPKVIKFKGVEHNVMDFQKPNKPYLIVQSLIGSSVEKIIHVITPNERQPIKIGRSQNSGLRILDTSVSRNHAQIQLKNGKYYLEDLDSKFGTLVRIKQKIQIQRDLTIQTGRTIYTFKKYFNYKSLNA